MADFMGSPATTLLPQDPEALRLQRQRMLAEALLAQSQQPINPNRMSGRFMSAISPLEGLAKMVQAGVGAYSMRKADDRMQEISDQRRQALVRALRGEAAPGSVPAEQVNPAAVAAMLEEGIDMSADRPKILTDAAVRESDVVITMGCGDTCAVYPGKRYLDWALDDPAGQGVDAVRPIRDEIRVRVQALVDELVG